MKIPFSKVSCHGNELKYVSEVLESGWLTTAKKAMAFEEKMAAFVGANYACAVNSCTAALHLGLEALGVKPGERVFVPDMTFTASAEVVRYLGADPVFLDVEYGTALITPEILEDAIQNNPDVRYLIVVHFGGQACEMKNEKNKGILDICKQNDIRILEDAAHAFPTRLGEEYVGTFGDITCFSFYANKTITTGEGGMLLTNSEDIYRRVKTMRLHGINRDVWDRFTSNKPSWEYDVIAPGYKYNMPDINAAIGLAQLEKAEDLRERRQIAAEVYYDLLDTLVGLDLPVCKIPFKDHAWHLFPVVLNEEAKVGRNELIEKLAQAGIGTSVHYKPLHHLKYYKERYQLKSFDFPISEKIWQGTLTLPLFPELLEDDVKYVCDTLKKFLN